MLLYDGNPDQVKKNSFKVSLESPFDLMSYYYEITVKQTLIKSDQQIQEGNPVYVTTAVILMTS